MYIQNTKWQRLAIVIYTNVGPPNRTLTWLMTSGTGRAASY